MLLYEPIEYDDAGATAAFRLLQADIVALCTPTGAPSLDQAVAFVLQRRASRSAEKAFTSRGNCNHPAWGNLIADVNDILTFRSHLRAGVDTASFKRLHLFVDENADALSGNAAGEE